jgi:uncharacterized protein
VAEVFVDTSAWYPLVVGDHADHTRVKAAVEDLLRAGARMVTSNLVVAETQALLLHRTGRDAALKFAQTVAQPPILVVPSSADVEQRAVADWLVRFADQSFSLADAVSFAIMKSRGINQALSLDVHFSSAGFSMLPTPSTPARKRR